MKYKDFLAAMAFLENEKKVDKTIILEALKEALAKAYRKFVEPQEADIVVHIDELTDDVAVLRQWTIVEEVEEKDNQISLEDARLTRPDAQLGEVISHEVSIAELGRPCALLAKNVFKQKIREAEKQGIYDEFIDKLHEVVMGMIETIEDKFIVVNLGRTLAIMPKAQQIQNERYFEGQKLDVVITQVSKESKGAQVIVSRADTMLVRRLFEREVPEIKEGTVEIKAIARDAGERTKMAVYSKNPDIDPIGACIGPKGSRVRMVIDGLHGEKIDIFEWSDDVNQLVRNALEPAKVLAVLPNDTGRGLIIVVADDQLSLAIGKKGKNARLAVKLTNQKIDIRTETDMENAGKDYKLLVEEYEAELSRQKREKEAAEFMKKQQEIDALEAERKKEAEALEAEAEAARAAKEALEAKQREEEEAAKAAAKPKRTRKSLAERASAGEYVSKLEAMLETPKAPVEKEKKPVRRKKSDEVEERRLRAAELKKDKDYEIKPEYTEEELAEIRAQEEREQQWEENEFEDYEDLYDFDDE
ncbi:MAG: transcription termination factor NusA [Erysipelotrichaceae bacterium]|jgi:N utilization substance protein A|nr:transcription termination factor NusA [Erysipelotrichaceae bacterium]